MKRVHLKQADIARKYQVSPATVSNWAKAASVGENNLQIVLVNKTLQILDNEHNYAELFRLAENGKKYKSSNTLKKTVVPEEFYSIFSTPEIFEIVNELEAKCEINLKYSYRSQGADAWSQFYLSRSSPISSSAETILSNNLQNIIYHTKNYPNVNIIDIGAGNAYPLKKFITEISKIKKIHKYIPVDISNNMNQIAKDNINQWFPEIEVFPYLADFEFSRFNQVFMENKILLNEATNIIMFFGNTICNVVDRVQVLKNIREAMTASDILVVSFTLDNLSTRSVLNYQRHPDQYRLQHWIPDMFGIDSELCELKLHFNEKTKGKYREIVLDKDYLISFDLLGKKKEIWLENGKGLITWRHYVLSIEDILHELKLAKLQLLNFSIDETLSNALVICETG